MSLPRPIHPYYFHADLIWWDSPFKLASAEIFAPVIARFITSNVLIRNNFVRIHT
jgi:hypothetical protein